VATPMSESATTSVKAFLLDALQATTVTISEPLQSLWGGQGSIVSITSDSLNHPVAVLKMIRPDRDASHPRGWNSDASFQRKEQSYVVECCWYEHYAHHCSEQCKVPDALGVLASPDQRLILLEDLTPRYPVRCTRLEPEQVYVCLSWLAHFHAQFLRKETPGLWPQGNYWHLATRKDEFAAMADGGVKQAAQQLDHRLRASAFQTLLHGDAKVANFCFSGDLTRVAAVDFQYVGQGCGMSDLAYLLGSCLSESDCLHNEHLLLDQYFAALSDAMAADWSARDCLAIEQEWRDLYDVAWTDFYRFLLGWMPEHPKINLYTQRVAERALMNLD